MKENDLEPLNLNYFCVNDLCPGIVETIYLPIICIFDLFELA